MQYPRNLLGKGGIPWRKLLKATTMTGGTSELGKVESWTARKEAGGVCSPYRKEGRTLWGGGLKKLNITRVRPGGASKGRKSNGSPGERLEKSRGNLHKELKAPDSRHTQKKKQLLEDRHRRRKTWGVEAQQAAFKGKKKKTWGVQTERKSTCVHLVPE